MKKLKDKFPVESFDITLNKYQMNQDNIKSLYAGEHLSLAKNDRGAINVSSYLGNVGELWEDDADEVFPYLNHPEKYYINTYVKKFYTKESIKLALVIIIDVYEKDQNFVEPEFEFLGDYVSEPKKWVWGMIMDDFNSQKISVTKSSLYQKEISRLEEWDSIKFIINDNTIDVHSPYGKKIGELSKKMSSLYIPYMRNPDNFLDINVSKVRLTESNELKCRLEVTVYKKEHENTNKPKKTNPKKNSSFSDSEKTEHKRTAQKRKKRKKERDRKGDYVIFLFLLIVIVFLIKTCSP